MRLLLIDGFYYIYRSFYAIRDLTGPDGAPVNAIYGFVKTVRRMVKDLNPDLGAVIWDIGLPKRRTELQPQYKATRTETPDAMKPQIPIIQAIAPMLGFASLGTPDTEADDLIASYAVAARAAGHEVIIATNDKDLFQLIGGSTRIYSTNKTDLASPTDTFALLGEDAVRAKWGVAPARISDVLALTGDTVDNIAGVDGIGPKGAAKLINEHGSLDAVLANLGAVTNEKLRAKLEAARGQIEQNREMVRLDEDLPLPAAIESLGIAPRYPELIESLEKCGFKSLPNEVRAEAAAQEMPRTLQQAELF